MARLPAALDRVPPQSLEAEQSTLGSMLISPAAVEKAVDMLSPEDFYRDAHRNIFETIADLARRDESVDTLTVQEELRRRGQLEHAGGVEYLVALIDSVPTAAHCEFYARIVQEKAILRRLIDASSQIAAWAYEEQEEVDTIVDQSERLVFGVAQRHLSQYFVPLRPLLFDAMEKLDAVRETHDRVTGIPTGLTPLDEMTSGLQPSDFIVVAGRPSMGKTALALCIGVNAAKLKRLPIAIFSLEMSKEQLVQRMICSEARVNGIRLRTGYLRDGRDGGESDLVRFTRAVGLLGELPVFIDDSTDLTANEMRAKCRRLQAEHGALGLVVVDYLQLIRGHARAENRNQEISEIARSLKSMARELKVPVMALSQLSRAVERREDKRPMLSDLRECVVGDTRLIDARTGALVSIREVRPGDLVLGVGGRQKIEAFPVQDVWSTGVKPVFTLTTQTGRVVTATENHPFLTATGWKQLCQLRPGDLIATAMRLPEHGQELAERGPLCRLLGYMTGDGTYRTHRAVGLCGSDPAIVNDAIQIVCQRFPGVRWRLKKAYGTYQEGEFARVDENGYGRPHGNPLREWLRGVGVHGRRDGTKRVPTWVFQAGTAGAREFLAGYFSTDGCVMRVEDRGWFVHFDTVSRHLAADVQMLLLRLGVVATIDDGYLSSRAKQPIYRVHVLGFSDNLRRFAAQIRPLGRKGELLDRMVPELPLQVTDGSLFGLPPEVSDLLFESSKHLRQQGRKLPEGRRLHWKPQGKRPRRDTCALFAERLKDEILHVWARSDLLWEEIRRIEPAGEAEVFDIRIPGCANFLANGIVAHNSGSIEAEADLVMMLYRSSYYRREGEGSEGEESPQPHVAGEEAVEQSELILAKHRNGPTGLIKLAFLREYARFENLADYE
jgi:replicative DNA helicase